MIKLPSPFTATCFVGFFARPSNAPSQGPGATINVHAGDVYPANEHEHGFLQGADVHEHAAHGPHLRVREHDEYPCDCANAYEPPLDVNEGAYVFQW